MYSGKRALLMLSAAVCCAPMLLAQARTAGQPAASVSGTVFDSLASRVLSGAAVRLVRQDNAATPARTVSSDSLGRFRFTDVRPGRYVLGLLHPALDALGLEPEPVSVAIAAGTTRRVDLAIPSATTLRVELCGAQSVRDAGALLIGFARRARDRAPLDSVIVTVTWRSRTGGSGGMLQPTRQQRVAASTGGWFVVCGAHRGDTIQLTARRNSAAAANLTLEIPASGLLQHDVLLSDEPAPTGVAERPTRDSGAPRPATGTLQVSGVVVESDGGRPIAGAIVRIAGGAVTRSDAQGAWRLVGLSRGPQTLTVGALRYAPSTVTISVAAETPPLRLALARQQGLLDTVNVVDEAVTDRNLTDFLRRSQTRGSGMFLSQADIASRRPTFLSELFLAIQGGMAIEQDSVGNRFLTMRSNTFRGDRCLPAIFIDGMSMRGLTIGDIDGLVRPSELFGIEVYRAANTPVEFSEQDGCGTILLWTKR